MTKKDTTPFSQEKSAEAASSASTSSEHDLPPPTYTPTSSSSTQPQAPPSYATTATTLTNTLTHGPPTEIISVPMVTRTVSHSLHNYNPFSHKQGVVKQSVVVRQMKRSHYLAHYAKDAEGNYIGTGQAAPDAALVFVPGKASSEDMVRQAEEVARKVQRLRGDGVGEWGKPVWDGYGAGGGMGVGGAGGGC
ncbi:hypothetical protein GMOD_00009302 [Pyrenophora seminiperda CCB06]|uniref:Uncharacterized protein n=1 Tax=Pyrenophora seminiperda CCB06 TaxID=1302712 RepID=A0A3M7MBV3_9PLEO|nr:hypothetical protein GMOD_00009302 [Pyrenophora seminiperda CCB06]